MMINKIPSLTLLILSFLTMGCSSNSSSDDDTPSIPVPSAASLVFPENNKECNEGIVDPNDDTKSSVTFEWQISENTDSYTLNLTNLNSNASTSTSTTINRATLKIDRATPYQWSVVSKAQGTSETATSSLFQFYNAGTSVENYAPFPAQAISPNRGENIDAATSVSLEWSASDIDNDIVSYVVLFGTDQNNIENIGTTSSTILEGVPIVTGNTYYWQVVTIDSASNSSSSELFSFRVN